MIRNTALYKRVPIGAAKFSQAVMENPSIFGGMGLYDPVPSQSTYNTLDHDIIAFANLDRSGALHSVTLKGKAPVYAREIGDRVDKYTTLRIVSVTFRFKGGVFLSIDEVSRPAEGRVPSYQDILDAGGMIRTEYRHNVKKYVRRVRDSSTLDLAKRITRPLKNMLGAAFDRGDAPKELVDMYRKHKMGSIDLLYYMACPYSQMIVPENSRGSVLDIEPGFYRNPLVRKAVAAGDFRKVIEHRVGNVTKPVMRAAVKYSKACGTAKATEVVQQWVPDGRRSHEIHPDDGHYYPVSYSGVLLNMLMSEYQVPLEKAAEITGRICVGDAVSLNKYSFMPYESESQSMKQYVKVRDVFALLGKDRAINFLFNATMDDITHVGMYANDAARMYKEFDSVDKMKSDKARLRFPEGIKLRRSWKNLKELHDDISRQYTKIKAFESRKRTPWPNKIKGLHGRRVDDLRILLPRTTTRIAMWGTDQNHCVAGYADKMVEGSQLIFGVYKSRKLTYVGRLTLNKVRVNNEGRGVPLAIIDPTKPQPHGEVVDDGYYSMSEIRSKSNGKVDPEDLKKIYGILMEYGVEDLYEGRF